MRPTRALIMPIAAGMVGLPLAYQARSWQSFATVREICPRLFCDFTDYYYPMGDAIFHTGLPVEGFLYSPFIAILLATFSPLGLEASLVLWGFLQCLFVSLYVLLFCRLVPTPPPIQLLFVALALTSYPVLLNLMGGQVSVFIMTGILGMLAFYQRRHRVAAASSLAVAVSFKYYPFLFLAPFAARRNRRFLLFAVAACVAFLLFVPAVVLGGDVTLRFYGALFDTFRDSGWVVTNPHSQFFPHVVLRLTGATGGAPSLLWWTAYGLAAINLGLAFLVQRARLRHADLWSLQLVFLTVPFVLTTSWPHDFVFLSFTQALLAWRLLDREASAIGAGKRHRAGTAITWLLLLASIVLSNVVFYDLVGDFTRYGFYSFLFWANLLLLIGLYIELLPPVLPRLAPVAGFMARR